MIDATMQAGLAFFLVAIAGTIAASVGLIILKHEDRKEALPDLAQDLEDRPDKQTAIVYGRPGRGEVRYVPPLTEDNIIIDGLSDYQAELIRKHQGNA